MARFVIAPHMRLHEWVAEEKGYFAAAGLDYEFRDELRSGQRGDATIWAIGSVPIKPSRRVAPPM